MKKILLSTLFIFSLSIGYSQSNCANAQEVFINSTTNAPAFTTETGTAPTILCGLTNGVGAKGKWYKFVATQDDTIIVTSNLPQSNNVDTRLIIYSGTCTGLVCSSSNDDVQPGTLTSTVTFPVLNGVTYYIVFDNKFSSNGFSFSVNPAPPPLPDRLSFTSTPVLGIAGNYNNCIVDMNSDGLDDIVSAISTTQLAISYQQASGSFTTNTFTVPNTTVLPSWSIAAGDYDNNGYNDLVYGSSSGVVFLKANSTGTGFTTDRKTQGYLVQRTNFVDINNDGLLDGFACDDNSPNRYYFNDTFGNMTEQTTGGIGSFPSGGNYASLWFDYDNDGDVDMHLSKCGQGGSGVGGNIDEMYRNNGDGTFTNVALAANLDAPEQTWSSAIGDFNNDGWMDIVIGVNSNSTGGTNVKRNNGDGTFTSVTSGSGYDLVSSTGREYIAEDFDNDGFLDVLGSGSTIMFGDGDFHFTPNPNTYPLSATDMPIGDLNNDGFLDIQNGNNILFNNGNNNNWFNINLQGNQCNRNGIGARIEIYGVWGKQIRDVTSGTGFQNMSTITAHFGLGEATLLDRVVITWPSGTVDIINNPDVNQSLLVIEGSTLAITNFNSSEVNVYPIPTDSVINITPTNSINIKSFKLYDLNGKLIVENVVSNNALSIEKVASGNYILILKDDKNKNYSQKIIKK